MAKSATLGQLNPASVPFFPGIRASEDDSRRPSFAVQPFRRGATELDRSSASSSDYRSSKSSPSPPSDDHPLAVQRQPSTALDVERQSPPFRQFDANRPYLAVENRVVREASMFGSLESLPEGEDTPGPALSDLQPRNSIFSQQQGRETVSSSTAPISINHSGSSYNNTGAFTSSSPVSSLDSGSQFTPSHELQLSFEAQLKASPTIRDIMDRLMRCEYSTKEIQRDLGDVQRKVNLLVERSLGTVSTGQPEFKDPFATSGSSFSNGPRPSLGNIAPNQAAPSDDITTISQRLNTLTSSVGQLLALQTQQIQSASGLNGGLPVANSALPADVTPPHLMPNQSMLGHGLPSRHDLRPGPRVPNPPMRTWSAGTLDLPLRQSDSISRTDSIPRDKRRSVSGLLRRDSSGILDVQNSDGRDGPLISKWEQLQLAPDLLRSLSKFGVGPPNKIQQRALPFLLRGSDIIAQAPPTQERIAAYVIPAIQIALTYMSARNPNRGPLVIMISTTVDQATQAQRMIRDLGGPIGVRSALGVGTTSASSDLSQELRLLQQNIPHIICGTPQKLHALFTTPGGLVGAEVRFLVLDEVDQLIARNLHEFVFNIVKLLPAPRSRPVGANPNSTTSTPSSFDANSTAITPANAAFPTAARRFSTTPNPDSNNGTALIERQTALFSNTVPQDVLNLATSIQLREPVRVLVRRDGNVTQADTLQGARGLRQYYLYLAFTAGGRIEPSPSAPGGGLGIIGSGRGATSAESVQAREWKLDALADLLDDVDVSHGIVHVGGVTALDAVVYKLASRGLEAIPLHGDMAAPTKLAALNKYRGAGSVILRQPATKVLVVYDVQIKDIPQVPLVVNYDLPKAVEEYAHRVAPAIAPNNYSRPGVIVNFVTATGGDVEMLRSIECFYKIKCPEVPMSLRDIV